MFKSTVGTDSSRVVSLYDESTGWQDVASAVRAVSRQSRITTI